MFTYGDAYSGLHDKSAFMHELSQTAVYTK